MQTGFLAALYFAFFAVVGIMLPFFPAFMGSLGFSATQVGVLMAINPAVALWAPPLWGQWADRSRRHARVLAIVLTGCAVAFAPMTRVDTFEGMFLCLLVYAVFSSSVTTLLDTLALAHAARSGTPYARLRLAGSLGFVASASVAGFALVTVGRNIVAWALGLMVVAACLAWWVESRSDAVTVGVERRANLSGMIALAKRPEVAALLLATASHWVACAPYHGTLALYAQSLSLSPSVLGTAVSVAVMAEIAVMATWARWAKRFSLNQILMCAFLVSSVRWLVLAHTTSAAAFVANALAHGFTFGAFYIASVSWLAEHTPVELRASAQSLFVAATFGVGGLVGLLGAGRLYDVIGGASVFTVAGALELIPLVVVAALLRPAREPSGAPHVTS